MAEGLKPGWRCWRFDQMATNVNERVDDPSESVRCGRPASCGRFSRRSSFFQGAGCLVWESPLPRSSARLSCALSDVRPTMNHEGPGGFEDLDPEKAWSISKPCSTVPVCCRALPDLAPDGAREMRRFLDSLGGESASQPESASSHSVVKDVSILGVISELSRVIST